MATSKEDFEVVIKTKEEQMLTELKERMDNEIRSAKITLQINEEVLPIIERKIKEEQEKQKV